MTQDYRCFKAYDIRGRIPDQLNDEIAWRIGRAFADFLGRGPLVIGRDMRTMAPEAQAAVIEGILDAGLDVIDIGLASTPQTYFAIGHLQAAGGLLAANYDRLAGWLARSKPASRSWP